MIDLTPIMQALVALGSTIITAMVIPYIKSKTGVQQFERMQSWTRIAVKAAEQLYPQPGKGKEKKSYVLEFLSQRGFALDEATLNALIESAVNSLNIEQYISEEGM